jgi:phosphoribosylanthranilate isomerase
MNTARNVRIKICCIASLEEANRAIALGASAVGLVSAMPSGPGPIPEDAISQIADAIPPGVATFLLTSKQDTVGIVAQQRRTKTNTIQIVDEFPLSEYAILRKELPGIKLVQVIHVRDERSITKALEIADQVDAILLDSGNPSLATKELGGTGRVHDWAVSRVIRENVTIPVYLAGGLNPENVVKAIEIVGPFAVDVCSGVRTDGRLDERKLSEFFKAVKGTLAGSA